MGDEKPERVSARLGRFGKFGSVLMVLEPGEYCCVCRAHEDLVRFGLGDRSDPLVFTVCNPCFAGEQSKFHEFLAGEFEKALAERPDKWRKNPDGTWGPVDTKKPE
jgi:hypothetical protein